MDLTLSSHLLVYRPMEEAALAQMASSGFSKIEVWLAEPHVPWRSERGLEKFRAQLAAHGLRAGSVHLPFYPSVHELFNEGKKWSLLAPANLDRKTALEGAAEGIRAASFLGADCAVLHLGWPGDAWSTEHHAWARDAVAELLPVARACQVQLLLENIISKGTRTSSLAKLLDEVDPAGEAGICLDLGHAHVEGNVLEELQYAIPRLAHLHVHDNDGTCDSHFAPGQGTIPWLDVLRALDEGGFQGQAALELRDFSKGSDCATDVLNLELGHVHDFRARCASEGINL
ncbi:MAG TPA: sugar phosphate isomerase/epimerase family protein [Planctomycetota bacterium]|jgi:sugar phosphate isomerase/epimerase|nr:hypothetical protein [Planctomycetota bacterium]HJM39320.1 sugar phosphate isomerase/epimerase family protein [Planctomycetota bacterium]|tara:strand:+ start:34089 stop:34949 length:861 start_codon:yes stop_codon:yes gene_type:complete